MTETGRPIWNDMQKDFKLSDIITLGDFKLILKGIEVSSLGYCDHLVCFSLSSCNVWLAVFFVYAYVLFLKGFYWVKLTFSTLQRVF